MFLDYIGLSRDVRKAIYNFCPKCFGCSCCIEDFIEENDEEKALTQDQIEDKKKGDQLQKENNRLEEQRRKIEQLKTGPYDY